MKKYMKFFTAIILVIVVAGTVLGARRKRVELIMPNGLITYSDACTFAEGYTLRDGEVKKYGNKLEVEYLSDPPGSGDNIKVELVYYSDDYPRSAVESLYNAERERLLVYEDLSETGAKAFVSFPSVFMYKSGLYIKITAGSGNDAGQRELLKQLEKTALNNLNVYLKKNKLK